MNIKKLIISFVFLIVGVFLISYGLTRPCEVGDITQEVQGQTITVNQPEKMNRMICLSTDFVSLISILLGSASIFPGVGGLYKSLVE